MNGSLTCRFHQDHSVHPLMDYKTVSTSKGCNFRLRRAVTVILRPASTSLLGDIGRVFASACLKAGQIVVLGIAPNKARMEP